jgi:hypothetical protein
MSRDSSGGCSVRSAPSRERGLPVRRSPARCRCWVCRSLCRRRRGWGSHKLKDRPRRRARARARWATISSRCWDWYVPSRAFLSSPDPWRFHYAGSARARRWDHCPSCDLVLRCIPLQEEFTNVPDFVSQSEADDVRYW